MTPLSTCSGRWSFPSSVRYFYVTVIIIVTVAFGVCCANSVASEYTLSKWATTELGTTAQKEAAKEACLGIKNFTYTSVTEQWLAAINAREESLCHLEWEDYHEPGWHERYTKTVELLNTTEKIIEGYEKTTATATSASNTYLFELKGKIEKLETKLGECGYTESKPCFTSSTGGGGGGGEVTISEFKSKANGELSELKQGIETVGWCIVGTIIAAMVSWFAFSILRARN